MIPTGNGDCLLHILLNTSNATRLKTYCLLLYFYYCDYSIECCNINVTFSKNERVPQDFGQI